jgi:hypothetical protein
MVAAEGRAWPVLIWQAAAAVLVIAYEMRRAEPRRGSRKVVEPPKSFTSHLAIDGAEQGVGLEEGDRGNIANITHQFCLFVVHNDDV